MSVRIYPSIQLQEPAMSSEETKKLIAHSFITLVNNTDQMTKVSVSDIVATSHKNRKTFYYHFRDKNSLFVWIFRRDMAAQLRSKFSDSQLLFTTDKHDPSYGLPYYTFVKEGVRQLDISGFIDAFNKVLFEKQKFYKEALVDTTPTGLLAYLYQLYVPALQHDIKFILSNRFLPKENRDFLAQFYASGIIGYFTRKVSAPGIKEFGDIGPFKNIVEDSIAQEIAKQQRARTL